jgi:AcrR family transcriptional regulator
MTKLHATERFDDVEHNTRDRILTAAARLIAAGGREAATTRAVATAADVQAPTIYRIFGDKDGLLDAVAEDGLAKYVAAKSMRPPHPDPVQDLREGWDMHVAFGLANPALYVIMSGDPNARRSSPAIAKGQDILRRRITNIALSGRLQVSETRAITILQAGCAGAVLTLLNEPPESRDTEVSAIIREAVLATLVGPEIPTSEVGPNGAATALRASLHQTSVLTPGESQLMTELLDRIVDCNPKDLSGGKLI